MTGESTSSLQIALARRIWAAQRGSATRHWIAFRVVDEHGRDALGAQLVVSTNGRKFHSTVRGLQLSRE
jgi:hypothetical protein